MERVCEHCQFYAAIGPGSGVCRKDEVVRHEVSAIFVCADFDHHDGAKGTSGTNIWTSAVMGNHGCFDEEDLYS